MSAKSIVDASKAGFLATWPGGYRENWAIYGKMSGVTEEEIVSTCIAPFRNPAHVALEIGCGLGFWTDRHLAPHFREVVALDLLADPKLTSKNIRYIEVPDRDFSCFGVEDESVDFVWSFGVFCHMTLEAQALYVEAAFRKLRAGGQAALYFANIDRRPGTASGSNTEMVVPWVGNDWPRTLGMMERAGFVEIRDMIPRLPDTMAYGRKP